MPKTTKRAASKRAARIAKAHATELPKLEVKEAPARRRTPGYKPPARGIARYPWATIFLTILVLGLGTWTLYFYHLGPFALPPVKAPATAAPSPCLKLVSKLTDTAAPPSAAAFKQIQHTYKQPPATTIDTHKVYCAGINTNRGLIVLELDPQLAPKTVNNFVFLTRNQYYDGLKFHRVVADFVVQGGDPQGTGSGGPGYKFNDEPVLSEYTAGALAMANSGPNTNGSQFFICTVDDTKKLAKSYNLFGYVQTGMDVVLKIAVGDTMTAVTVQEEIS